MLHFATTLQPLSCILQPILEITVAFCNHFARTVILYQYSIHFTSKPDVSKYYNNNQNSQLKTSTM